jgi:hypothetical protein
MVGTNTYLPAAHIEGTKSTNTLEHFTEYFLTGSISNVKKAGLTFKIVLRGDGEELVLMNDSQYLQSSGNYVLPANASLNFLDDTMYRMVSTKNYNLVCIRFMHNNNDLKQYFDEVDGTEICNRLIDEG